MDSKAERASITATPSAAPAPRISPSAGTMYPSAASSSFPRPHRLPLSGRSPHHLSFERRIRLWIAALAIPSLALAGVLVFRDTQSLLFAFIAAVTVALLWAIATSFFFEQMMRPLQTLSNVVAALREDDFSFRARGARRGDSLGDLALEVNALASTLQHQRLAALDAITLVELVMTSMQSPVLAFDAAARLHLLNPAAERVFHLSRQQALGRTAQELNLTSLLALADQGLYNTGSASSADSGEPAGDARWSVRRTTFRLRGIPHSLFVLADVAAALREEERLAWQRLIRVLGHEINNSLTPIKSIAGSLRSRLLPAGLGSRPAQETVGDPSPTSTQPAPQLAHLTSPECDFDRGLAVIEDRADSLNRFLQAYQRLSRLPAPVLSPTPLEPLITRIIQLETRLSVQVSGGPDATLIADADQLEQLLINLIRNAADAALISHCENRMPQIEIGWSTTAHHTIIRILDNGIGMASTANLFVPFYTTKPGGTGVGLVLAQQIATAHRGTLTLRNREGAPGCEAEIRLPLLQ